MATPFGSVYASVFTPLTTAAVRALVPTDNQVRHDTERPPLIDDRQPGDLPSLELLIEPGAPINLHSSSDEASVDMLFRLEYRTDQEKLAAEYGLFPLFWAVLRAYYTAGVTLGNSYIVSWDITTWEPLDPFEIMAEAGMEQGRELGWRSSMQVLVHTTIPHSELLVT